MYPLGVVYDFVTNPANWTKTYPRRPRASATCLTELPLKVGDTWDEGASGSGAATGLHVACWRSPRVRHCSSSIRSGDSVTTATATAGCEGRITDRVPLHLTAEGITLFTRTMTIETYKHAPLPDGFFRMVNPAQHRRVPRCRRAGTRRLDRPERPPQRRSLQVEQPLAGIPLGDKRIEPVAGAGEDVRRRGRRAGSRRSTIMTVYLLAAEREILDSRALTAGRRCSPRA